MKVCRCYSDLQYWVLVENVEKVVEFDTRTAGLSDDKGRIGDMANSHDQHRRLWWGSKGPQLGGWAVLYTFSNELTPKYVIPFFVPHVFPHVPESSGVFHHFPEYSTTFHLILPPSPQVLYPLSSYTAELTTHWTYLASGMMIPS